MKREHVPWNYETGAPHKPGLTVRRKLLADGEETAVPMLVDDIREHDSGHLVARYIQTD